MPNRSRAYFGSRIKNCWIVFLNMLAAAVILICCLSSCSRGNETGLNPGDIPPQFQLESIDGPPQNLSDYNGKVVLLNFWASWCGPCVEELPALQALYDKIKDKGFVVIAVGVDDTKSSLMEFKQRYGLTFPLLIDSDGQVKSRYKVSGVPESFVIGSDGRLLMMSDPSGNMPVLRFIGPREWSSPNSLSRFEKLLFQNSNGQ